MGIQTLKRRRLTIRQKAHVEAEERIQRHRERMLEEAEALSSEQEAALAAETMPSSKMRSRRMSCAVWTPNGRTAPK